MSNENITLHSFCKDHNLAKTTVRRWLNENGHSTSDGLSPQAVADAIAQFCPQAVDPTEPTQPANLVVVEGNVDGLETPAMSVYQFKMPEVLATTMGDPLALAAQFVSFGDQLIEQLDHKQATLQKRADDTRLASQMIADKTRRMAAAQRTAEIHEVVTTQFIQRDMADIQRQTGV